MTPGKFVIVVRGMWLGAFALNSSRMENRCFLRNFVGQHVETVAVTLLTVHFVLNRVSLNLAILKVVGQSFKHSKAIGLFQSQRLVCVAGKLLG